MFFSGLMWHYAALAADYIYFMLNIDKDDFGSMNFLKPLMQLTILLIFRLLGILIYLLSFRYILLLLMTPVLAMVSERVEEIVTGKAESFRWIRFFKDTFRGMLVVFRNTIKGILYSVLIFFLSFVPPFGLVSPLLWFLLESYYYGFSMLDYSLERRKISVQQSERFVWRHKWLAITIGSIFNVLVIISVSFSVFPSIFVNFLIKVFLMIPLLAISVAPIYGAVAGTLAMLKIQESTRNHDNF